MSNEPVKIGLVFGVIFLFICTGITPSIAVDTVKNSSLPISNGKTLYVGGGDPGNYTRIQDAIDNASDGDTIYVYNGTFIEFITITNSNIYGEKNVF